MKRLILMLMGMLFTATLYSQSINITGVIQGSENETLPGTSVMLIGAQDSILKSYSITNKEGKFNLIGIKSGDYFIKVSSFGYTPYEKSVSVKPESENMDFGIIELMPKSLNTVVVEGEYIPMQIKGDTLEYDSRAFEVKEHDVVEDLLKQLPGIEVDENGTITVQGEEVDQVLVDGEKFFGDDATIATKNLPAKSVDKVQVFDKKSDQSEFTGVDEGEEKTTINLKLKESHKKGTFGNISAGAGTQIPTNDIVRYEGKANVFSFKKKWQLSIIGMSNNINQTGFTYSDYKNFMGGAQGFMRGGGDIGGVNVSNGDPDDGFLTTHATGVNFTYKPSGQTMLNTSVFFNSFDKIFNKTLERETYFTDSTLITNEIADQSSISYNGSADLSFEQKWDSTHMLNIYASGNLGRTTYDNTNSTFNLTDNLDSVSTFATNLNQIDYSYAFNGSANYRKKFLKSGRYTGIDASYARTNTDITTYLDYLNSLYTNGVPASFLTNQEQFNIQTTETMGATWTWSEPISKNSLLQLDLSFNRIGETRDKDVFDNVSDVLSENPILSGDGIYHRTHANAELRHKLFLKKIKTTLGAKYKYLNLSGEDIFTNPKEFHFILPNARFEWDPNKTGNMRLTYNTSISAPTLNQLQPIPDNTNPSQLILGNIDLRPEYTHNVQIRYRNFNQFNFTFFMVSLGGSYTDNNIIYSQQTNEFYVTTLTPENIGSERGLNAFVVYGTSVHPLKTKFSIHASGNLSNGLINLNGMQDGYVTYSTSPSIRFENIGKEIVDIRTGFSYTYSLNTYQQNSNLNNSFQNYDYYVNLTFKIKDRWLIKPVLNHYFFPAFEDNNQLLLMDFTVACNFLESRKLQVYITGRDLLNQNTGLNQYYLQNMYERETTQTLGRYVMLGVKYSFTKLGSKKDD